MVIQNNHRNVDSEGLVSVPYMTSWTSSSSLIDLLHIVSAAFSNAPPLYMKRKDSHIYANNHNNYNNNNINGSNSNNNNNNNNNNNSNRNVQGTVIGISDHSKNNANIATSRRQELIDEVTKKLQNELLDYYVRLNSEVNDGIKNYNYFKSYSYSLQLYTL